MKKKESMDFCLSGNAVFLICAFYGRVYGRYASAARIIDDH